MAEVTGLRNNALPYPVYGVPYGVTFPILDADGDLVTGASGLDSEISKNGDTFADCTNEATEIATSSGVYYLLLTATEMTADVVSGIVKTSTSGAKTTVFTLYPRKLPVLATGTAQGSNDTGDIQLASGESAVNDTYNGCLIVATIDTVVEARIINDYVGSTKVAEIAPAWNTAQPDSDDTYTIYLPEGRQVPTVNVTHVNAVDTGSVTAVNANLGTTQPVSFTGTGASAKAKADVQDWGGTSANIQKSMVGGFPQVDALTLKDEAPDTLVFGEVRDNLDIVTTTATGSPTSTTVRLSAGSTIDDFYNDQLIYISTGTGIGQARPILDYVGSTKEVTVDEPFIVTPASGDGISIRVAHVHPISQIADAVCDEALSGHSTSGTVGKAISDIVADTNELQTNQGNWLTATGFSTHSAADAASAVWTVGNMATAAMKRVADFVLRRNTANAAASTETGLDTLSFRSQIGANRKLHNAVDTTTNSGKLTIFEEDDTTEAATQTLATDASAEPITGANTD